MKERKASVQEILELSCSAYRTLGKYIKEAEFWFKDIDPKQTPKEVPNKLLIQCTLRYYKWEHNYMPPKDLVITQADKDLADEIRAYYRRLAFTIIGDDNNSFDSTVFSYLNATEMEISNVGFIAYLPEKYRKELSLNHVTKVLRTIDNDYLGSIGTEISDLDGEIIDIVQSKNYDAYNIHAVIDNKLCSWMTKSTLKLGPAIIINGKIKEHSKHWKYNNNVTRLHYVRIFQ
jgi:hypothetical protein